MAALMGEKSGANAPAGGRSASRGMMVGTGGGFFGYIVFGVLADLIGRRGTVSLFSLGTVAAGLTLYLALPAYEPWYPVVLPIFGFFVIGVFSGYAVYLPELFPTQIRSTAVGFCTASAPIITSFGPPVAGLLVPPFVASLTHATAPTPSFPLLSTIPMYL